MMLSFLVATGASLAASSDVIVRLKATTDVPLLKLYAHEMTREGVHARLVEHSSLKQASLIQLLSVEQATYQSFWIENAISVKGASDTLIDTLKAHADVLAVDRDESVSLPRLERDGLDAPESTTADDPQGNVAALNTAAMWKAGNRGKGVVIASIDSGVRWTHEAVKSNYRGLQNSTTVNHDYSFWDGTSQDPHDPSKLTPDNADIFGHGSHTMGTLAGGGPKNIGVAPEATWIHARAFNWNGDSKQSAIMAAAEWVLCPTKYDGSGKDCSKGAHVVSCSFGGNSTTTWLNPAVKAMRSAGVLPVFAAGNVNAFTCGSVTEPAGSDDAIAVGGSNDGIYYQSSGKGPGMDNKTIKPDFVAPARAIVSICSAGDSGNDAYMRLSGTSMATPHVSGALALLLGAGLKPEDAVLALRNTAKTKDFKKPFFAKDTCGGTAWNVFPNNIFGWGLPDVCAAAKCSGDERTVVV